MSDTPIVDFRLERDPLGEKRVPSDALFGVQTLRALEHFQISALRIHPGFITAYAEVKKAAALANVKTKKLTAADGDAIIAAADEIIDGGWRDHFRLDVFQAGAGTSYNMNVNEVITNRALELLGSVRGDYVRLNPLDDVNKSQSTNDTMPTAMRVATIRLLSRLLESLERLAATFTAKSHEFADVEKSARTHLHDAVPITLGDEMAAYAETIRRSAARLRALEQSLCEVPLGGTAVGTGTNADRRYMAHVVERLTHVTGLPLRPATNRVQSTQSLGDFLAVSAGLRVTAVELSKIANDLRLLNSGPHTGLFEIELPAVQPGSSIMPGKVNPALCEMLSMTCYHVIGHDTAITMAAEAGQLELNVMMPYVAYALLESLDVLSNAVLAFERYCVQGIKANEDRCREYRERTVGLAALHSEKLGYMGAAELAKQAEETGKSIPELLREGKAVKLEA